MATIIDNIKKVHNGFTDDVKQAKLLLVLKTHAVPATVEGIGSDAGKTYMSMFADNEEQLNLLTSVVDHPSKPWLHETQAYLVANSICAPSTNGKTGNGIFGTAAEGEIDVGVPPASAPGFAGTRPDLFNELFPVTP